MGGSQGFIPLPGIQGAFRNKIVYLPELALLLPRTCPTVILFVMDTRARTHSLTLAGVPLMSLHMRDMLPTPWGNDRVGGGSALMKARRGTTVQRVFVNGGILTKAMPYLTHADVKLKSFPLNGIKSSA